MHATIQSGPLKLGDRAPSVALDAINREGKVSTDDFRGRKPVLVGIYRGLQCAFCRRQLMMMSQLDPELRARGIETLTIVNTPAERARSYLRYRPMENLLASDPTSESHRAFGLPSSPMTPRLQAILMRVRVNPDNAFPQPVDLETAKKYMDAEDKFEWTPADHEMEKSAGGQFSGQFLLDRDGFVRWSFVEGFGTLDKHPSPQQVISAAAAIA